MKRNRLIPLMTVAPPRYAGRHSDCWDVLAYVHAYFHLGLAEWKTAGGPTDASGTKTRSPNHSEGG